MINVHIALTPAHAVTTVTLNAQPARVVQFVEGTRDPAIAAQLVPVGWSQVVSDEAYGLLNDLRASTIIPTAPEPNPGAEAVAKCVGFQHGPLERAHSILQLRFPEQSAFLFHDYVAGSGIAAVINVETFIQRREQLATGTDRKGTRKVDHEALALLVEHGIDKATIKNLEEVVRVARTVVPVAIPPLSVEVAAAKRELTLRKMHAWLTAWSGIARTVITRRDHLIRLGIAKRRTRKANPTVVTPAAPPVTPAPPPTDARPVAPVNKSASTDAEEVAPESNAA